MMIEAKKVNESSIKGAGAGTGEGDANSVKVKVNPGVTSSAGAAAANNLPPMSMSMSSTRKNLSGGGSRSLLDILGVDLIAEKLLPFLNLEDLKALSAACWGTLYAVRKLSDFSNLARLHLSAGVLKNGLLKLGEDGDSFTWKHLSLNLGPGALDLILDLEPLREALEVAESLKLYHGVSSWYPKDDPPGAFPRLERVLKQTRGLKWLGLEVGLLNQEAHPEFFVNPEVQRVLRGVDGLVILGYRDPDPDAPFCNRLGDYYTLKSANEHELGKIPLHQNMLQLSLAHLQLKHFSFKQYFLNSFERKLEPGKFLKAIIASNRGCLEVIELHLKFLSQVEIVEEIHCPNLKRLKLRANGRLNHEVEHFLMAQPPLEELDIYLDERCDFNFIPGLVENGKLGKLTRLHLDTDRCHLVFGDEEDPNLDVPAMDWQFLSGMSPLKDFSFTAPVSDSQVWNGIGEEILRRLPPTTEKISLKGLSSFWKDEGSNIGALLSRFQNLTKLDLLGSIDTVTDEGMQSLIVNCPKLTSLTISWCRTLTDFGVTGVRIRNRVEERTGISLDQLKGLKHLTIKDCFKISREGLLSVLKFMELRSLDYRDYIRYLRWSKELFRWLSCCGSPGDRMMDTSFILRAVRQNPSLEKLCMCPFEMDREHPDRRLFRILLKRINPRLKAVRLVQWRMVDFF